MLDIGIEVSQPGKNVLTAEDNQKIIDSNLGALAIVNQGQVEQTGNSGSTLTFTIRHGVNFVPFVLVYYKSSFYPDKWQLAPGQGAGPGVAAFVSPDQFIQDANTLYDSDYRIDKENIILRVNLNNGANDTVTIRYFVFNVPIALSI